MRNLINSILVKLGLKMPRETFRTTGFGSIVKQDYFVHIVRATAEGNDTATYDCDASTAVKYE